MTEPDDETIGTWIASLAPDVSWAAGVPVPSMDQIRERVRNYTPEQLAAAERLAAEVEGDQDGHAPW